MKENKGFTLIEIMVVLALSAIILTVIITSYYDLAKKQALDKDYLSVASLLDQAKSSAINSKSASQYGVYFASSSAVLFKGQTYVSNNITNQTYLLNNRVSISALNLVGSSTDRVLFSRLTGYANASGTITLSLKDSPTTKKIIKVYKTGVIEYK